MRRRIEVGFCLVLRALTVVGPGALRAPRIVSTGERPERRIVDFDDEGSSDAAPTGRATMDVLYPRCAGLDVHKDTVVACVRCVSPPEHRETRQYSTTTSGLLELADWLGSH